MAANPSPRAHPPWRGAAPFLAGAVLFPSWGCGAGAEETPGRANLLLVALDTVRPDRLGVYGCERATTPLLDDWAREAAVFEEAQSASPWTAPALVSLMTSLYPSVHQVRAFPNPGRMSEDVTTLAEVLRARGYATAAFTEGGYAKGDFGLDQGFDHYARNEGDEESHTANMARGSRLAANVDRALEWLRAHGHRGRGGEGGEGRFFLFFHTYEAHSPYRAREELLRRFRPGYDEAREHDGVAAVIRRWNEERALDAGGADLLLRHHLHCGLQGLPAIDDEAALRARTSEIEAESGAGPSILKPENLAFLRDLYDACLAYVDQELERIWSELRALGLEDETLVVIASDHGEAFGEHGRVGHGTVLHQELMRSVLLMRGPGVRPGRVRAMVRSIDVMPTVLELLGAGAPGLELQGQSLVAALSGRGSPLPAYGHGLSVPGAEDRAHTLRAGSWRLVVDDLEGPARLYDVASDPLETRDLSGDQAQAAARLRELLDEVIERNESLRRTLGGELQPRGLSPADEEELRRLGYIEGRQR